MDEPILFSRCLKFVDVATNCSLDFYIPIHNCASPVMGKYGHIILSFA